jgi:hypothetical protein
MGVEFARGEKQRDDGDENEIVHDETLPPDVGRA